MFLKFHHLPLVLSSQEAMEKSTEMRVLTENVHLSDV